MICQICRKSVATRICRRCSRRICERCHFHHGLCVKCREEIRKK